MFEVAENNADMVKLLLREEAKVNYESKDGWTALVMAVHSSDYRRMGPESPSPYAPLPGVNVPVGGANFRTDLLALPGADESLCHAYRLGARMFAGVARTSAPDN